MAAAGTANPLLDGLGAGRKPEPSVLTIFAAAGDLTRRKLLPAIYSLALRDLLPERFAVLGVARTAQSEDAFRARLEEAVRGAVGGEFRAEVWERLARAIRY